MKLPGVNYNWNVTAHTKADIYAPIKIANAKTQAAGAIASVAGSGAQVAQSFRIADERRDKEEEEFRQVQAAQDAQIANDDRKFEWDQAVKKQSDSDYKWKLDNSGVTTYTASQVGDGVIAGPQETKSIVLDGEVAEVENDEIPAWKVQPAMYKRDATAGLEAAVANMSDWEDKRALMQSGTEQIDATYLKMTVAARGQQQAYVEGKAKADINELQDQGRHDMAGELIKAFPGGAVEQQELAEDNKTKQEKWLYQGAINARSIDAANKYLTQLRSDDYQTKFGGLNRDEQASYINGFERIIAAEKTRLAAANKFDDSKMKYDIDQTTKALKSGKWVHPDYIAKSKREAKFLKDEVRVAKLDSADNLQTQFLGAAYLPTKDNMEVVEKVRNQASRPEDINSAEDFDKLMSESNAERDNNMMDWADGMSPNKMPDIRQGENEAEDIRARVVIANQLRMQTKVYTGFLKENEVTMEANKLNSYSPEQKYDRMLFMQETIPEDIRGYTNQLMKNNVGGSFPVAMNLMGDGKPHLAKEVLVGEEIRAGNKDIGTNYKSNANLEFSQVVGNAYDGTPTERGRVYEASLDIMAARSGTADAGSWDSDKYKQIVLELSDGIIEMDGNNFVRKVPPNLPDKDFTGWVDTMDYSEIDKLALDQGVDMSVSSKKVVKGIRSGDITFKGPYNGGYLLYDVKGDRLLSDKKDENTPFILMYDDKYITETEAGRVREAKAVKDMPKEQKAAVKTYREREGARVGGSLDFLKTDAEKNAQAPSAGPFKF